MTKLTHDKIAAGLNEALATAPPLPLAGTFAPFDR